MNELAMREQRALVISDSTKELIRTGVSENTLRAYRRALVNLEAWMAVKENASRLDSNGIQPTE